MLSIVKQVFFLFNTLCIFFIEFVFSLVHQNNKKFIHRLASQLARKNILYVKLFQAIALNKNFINDEINNELMIFTDSAPYNNHDINFDLLQKIKEEYKLVCHSNTPFKAGMISLVFKMYNESEDAVILKIKRKNIDKNLSDAIENVRFFVTVMSFLPYLNSFDIHNVFNKNIETLKQQLDFNEEVYNMIEASNNCKTLKYIKIPRVYNEVTKKYPDVILMEYIEGKTIREIDEVDYSEYAALLLKYGMVSLLFHGVTHGDLHAGNILFLKNNHLKTFQLCLLDFGLVLRFEERTRKTFMNVVSELFDKPSREIAREVLYLYIEPLEVLINLPNNHLEHILDMMEKIIDKTIHNKNEADQTKLFQFLLEINAYISNNNLNNYGLKVNETLIKTQMALAMCNGINMVLCKNDYMTFANKTINEMFHVNLLQD